MEEITKQQVIELMDKINRDGIDNTHYDIVHVQEECEQKEAFAGCNDILLVESGTYCVVYSGGSDFGDIPFTMGWVNSELSEENIDIFYTENGLAVIICLDKE